MRFCWQQRLIILIADIFCHQKCHQSYAGCSARLIQHAFSKFKLTSARQVIIMTMFHQFHLRIKCSNCFTKIYRCKLKISENHLFCNVSVCLNLSNWIQIKLYQASERIISKSLSLVSDNNCVHSTIFQTIFLKTIYFISSWSYLFWPSWIKYSISWFSFILMDIYALYEFI